MEITASGKYKHNKKFIITLLLTLTLAFIILVYVGLSGGISGAIASFKLAPNPNSSHIVSRRNKAINSISSNFLEIDSALGYSNFGTSTHDRCYKGQNNAKVQDGYAHRCTYRLTKFYGFNGDFRQQMINLEQQLFTIGWKPGYGSMPPLEDIMENYYDKYYGDKDPEVSQNFGGHYLISDLPRPSSGYIRDKNLLDIDYAEKDTKDLFEINFAQNVNKDTLYETYDKKDFKDTSKVFQHITKDNKYILVISIQEDYFQN